MNRIVLIDGENLIYGLRSLLGGEGVRADRSILHGYSYRGLIDELLADNLPTKIVWFGTKLKLHRQSPEIQLKSELVIKQQSFLVNELNAQNIEFVKVGHLQAREMHTASGKTEWSMIEKGLDVGLAIEIVSEANSQTEIVVVSADTDQIPALRAAHKLGAKIMHIGYEVRPIAALSHVADATRLITVPLARKHL